MEIQEIPSSDVELTEFIASGSDECEFWSGRLRDRRATVMKLRLSWGEEAGLLFRRDFPALALKVARCPNVSREIVPCLPLLCFDIPLADCRFAKCTGSQ